MSTEDSSVGISAVDPADPVVRVTRSNPLVDREALNKYIQSLDYQNDMMTTVHLSAVLREMPDFMVRYPFVGGPFTKVQKIIEENEVLHDKSCQFVFGLNIQHDEALTVEDLPTIEDNEVNFTDYSTIIEHTQSTVESLITDTGLFSFQYTDPTVPERNHTVLYSEPISNYDYFIYYADGFTLTDSEGGKAFLEIEPVEVGEQISELLEMKSSMLVDMKDGDQYKNNYWMRFIQPLFSPFAASLFTHTDQEPDALNSN